MRLLRCGLLIACCGVTTLAFGQKEDWLPITEQDQKIHEVPGNPGASAIQLYYANYIDDNAQTEFEYHRIKILNEQGKKEADVEIRSWPGVSISNLKARTVHPDGSIVEFTGKPFDKTVYKGQGIKWSYKTFTMPDVTVGSIIEFKFKTDWLSSESLSSGEWIVQHSLYTVKENFTFKGNEQVVGRINWVVMNLKTMPTHKGASVDLEMRDVPAFESEDNMPPEENYKSGVRFFYTQFDFKTADKFWEEIGKRRNRSVEDFIGNRKEAREAAEQAIGNESDPEKKLRKLYARAQQIRNLSYERERSEKELKKEKIKDPENVGDVLKRGYGYQNSITRTFVAMARAAGFEASIVRTSDRSQRFFAKEYPSESQLPIELADVKLGDKEVYLQPGAKFCPYGTIRWMYTSVNGLKLDKNGGVFITVPPALPEKSVALRTAQLELDGEGNAKGEITLNFTGQGALDHRTDANDTDEAGRKKDLENELRSWLSSGAIVKLTSVEGWDTPDEPLAAHFDVQLPAYGSLVGKRMILPSALFRVKQNDAFKHADRKYPVYFPYAFTELDDVTIKLRPGVKVESLPTAQNVQTEFADYRTLIQSDGTQLRAQRVLAVGGFIFPLTHYPEVKEFFSKVQAGDEQQAVLQGATNAQKSN
jgi:Domain of Unknown Function with PDB structure (DUF3857)/Transglutaminase-like superfamily